MFSSVITKKMWGEHLCDTCITICVSKCEQMLKVKPQHGRLGMYIVRIVYSMHSMYSKWDSTYNIMGVKYVLWCHRFILATDTWIIDTEKATKNNSLDWLLKHNNGFTQWSYQCALLSEVHERESWRKSLATQTVPSRNKIWGNFLRVIKIHYFIPFSLLILLNDPICVFSETKWRKMYVL
jgi:hypothetical protein